MRESVFAAEDSENGRCLRCCLHEKADFFGCFLLREDESEPEEYECPCLTQLNDDESSELVWPSNSSEVTSPTFFCESHSGGVSTLRAERRRCLDLTPPRTEAAACSISISVQRSMYLLNADSPWSSWGKSLLSLMIASDDVSSPERRCSISLTHSPATTIDVGSLLDTASPADKVADCPLLLAI